MALLLIVRPIVLSIPIYFVLIGVELLAEWWRLGWRPVEQGGPTEIPAVGETSYQKYQPTPARGVPGYVLAQYAVITAVAALFVFTQKNMAPATRYLLAA